MSRTTDEDSAHAPGTVIGPAACNDAGGDQRVRSLFRRFWPFTHGLRRWMAVAAPLVMLLPVVQAAEIWLFKSLVDEVLVPGTLDALPTLIVAYVALNLISGALSFGDTMLSAWVGERFLLRVRTAVFGHLLRLSPLQVGTRPVGDVLTRLSGDVSSIEGFLVGGPSTVFEHGARIVVFVGVLVWIDPVLALVALIATPLFCVLGQRFSGSIRDAAREKRRRTGALQSLAEEVLAALPQVQAASAEDHELRRFEREGRAVVRAEMRASRTIGLFRPLIDLVELAGGLAVVTGGAWARSSGRVTLGELLAFMTYLTQLYSPVRGLADLAASASKAAAGAERIAEILDDVPAVVDADAATDPGPLRGVLKLEGVSFTYPGADRRALDDVSVTAEPGTVTAIVGPSGSGKSTLVWLLLRMADPDQGTVTLDDHGLSTLPLRTVRGHVGVLLQDTYLFDGSVADNVAYGDPEASQIDIARALLDADADGFVAEFPDGQRHRLGPKGRSLSGGQRRRLALARALHHRCPVLVLDEFSTGLDQASTAGVLAALRHPERTIVLITHDPAVAAIADRTITLEAGRLVEPARLSEPRISPTIVSSLGAAVR